MTKGFLLLAAVVLALGCTAKAQTNVEKCLAMGGVYNSASRSCQLPSEAPAPRR